MLKKIITAMRAAVVLIMAENVAALRTFSRNVKNRASKPVGADTNQDAMCPNEKNS